MSRRRPAGPVRAATVLPVALTTALLLAGPALADPLGPSEGGDPHAQVSTATAVLLYVVVPALVLALITALVWLPGTIRGQRYRPQRGTWGAEPVWFAGPPDPVAAVAAAQADDTSRGGARGSW